MRKLSVFLLSLLLFCSSMIGSTVVSSAAEVVPDENLRKVINLELGNGEVTDSITIAQLNSLTGTLYASDKDIESIEGLQYATGLTRIYLIGNQISDTGPVSGLTSLKGLYLSENQIADVTSLSGLTNLTQLSLNENEISDITPLSGLTKLKGLYLRENQIEDISPLSGLDQITQLSLIGNQIEDISSLAGLDNLKNLYMRENQIEDISPLAGLGNLTKLYLDDNRIQDISPIQGLTLLKKFSAINQSIDVPVPSTFESMIVDVDGVKIPLTTNDENAVDNGDGTYTLIEEPSALSWVFTGGVGPFSGVVTVLTEKEEASEESSSTEIGQDTVNQDSKSGTEPGTVKKSPETGNDAPMPYEAALFISALLLGVGIYQGKKKKYY